MRIVVALGGNALLKRGEPPDSDIQESHVAGAVLNQAAQTAKRSPEFAATYAAITQRRGKKIATIAISRKLLTRAYAEHHEPRRRGDEQCARQPRRSQKEGARRDDARSHHEREIARMKILDGRGRTAQGSRLPLSSTGARHRDTSSQNHDRVPVACRRAGHPTPRLTGWLSASWYPGCIPGHVSHAAEPPNVILAGQHGQGQECSGCHRRPLRSLHRFVEATGAMAAISRLSDTTALMNGTAGTTVVPS